VRSARTESSVLAGLIPAKAVMEGGPDHNLLERFFVGERRRTKIMPHALGERPARERFERPTDERPGA
jgi:hypothetical protein